MQRNLITQCFRAMILAAALGCSASTFAGGYGLAPSIQEGTILHCFDWKYSDIRAMLPQIAAAGFTSVQTSPAQPDGSGTWYWLYQPTAFAIGPNGLGDKAELQALCTEADKYGIKVVVDVVANHLNGQTSRVQRDLQDARFWHTTGSVSSWNDRYQVTHGEIGMRDLNSEDGYVQQVVARYVDELKAVGVDGIRWDAAKHIGLPSEGCKFWPAVTAQGLYHYGEILEGPVDNGGEGLMKEYTRYMSVTDNSYGRQVVNAFRNGQVPQSSGNWSFRGCSDTKLVYWAESHDTYSNEGRETTYITDNQIDRAYAVVAAQNGATSLYFSRPYAKDKEAIKVGAKGSTHFTSREVAAVNHFHNALNGQKSYYAQAGGVASVCRRGGAVIVMGSGSGHVTAVNGGAYTEPGTYTDEVSGGTFTVTATTISGNVGPSGIAVIYRGGNVQGGETPTPEPSVTTVTDPNPASGVRIYYSNPGGWSQAYCYVYGGESASNGQWPGVPMTYDASLTLDGRKGWYVYEVPSELQHGNFIVSDGGSNQYPAAMQPGVQLNGRSVMLDGEKSVEMAPAGGQTGNQSGQTVGGAADQVAGIHAYFVAPAGWSMVKCWAWDEAHGNASYTGNLWPGEDCTKAYVNSQGEQVWLWRYTGTLTAQPTHIIFNNGSASGVVGESQTRNLEFVNGGYYNLQGATTAVRTVRAPGAASAAVYTLGGVRLATPVGRLPRGIYIIGGRKVAVK